MTNAIATAPAPARFFTFTSNALTVEITMFPTGEGYNDLSDGFGVLAEIPGIVNLDWTWIESFDFEMTANVGITYQYCDPDESEESNGEATDLGYAVLDIPENANPSLYDLELPLGLIPIAMNTNNWAFKGVDTNTKLDEDQLEKLYDHQFFCYSNGDLVKSYSEFIGIVASPNFSMSFDTCDYNHCSISIHSPS